MKDFIELIKDKAKNCPEQIAIIDGERKINYGEFLNLVNSISHRLMEKKTRPKVIVDLKQGIESYALIVATLNVGGTYCPLNPDTPAERKQYMIDEFAPDFIGNESEKKKLELQPYETINLSELQVNTNTSDINGNYDREDIIYVIYTSGSTGTPKGVKVCRKALNKFLEWSIPTYAANENDIWGQFSYLSFDLSIVDIFTCLCSGATLYTVADDSFKNFPASIIDKVGITIWHSSPIVINAIMKREKSKPSSLTSLRLMSFCGAPLTLDHAEFLFSKNKNLTIYNTYGPTEGTLFCTWQSINYLNYKDYSTYTVSLGQPIPEWNIHLQPISDTHEFEVVIYGDYIGKGYLSEVTDSGFSHINPNGKLYPSFTTGDIVYKKNDTIFFDSRKDRQVKINGNRVELAGIEYHIRNFANLDCVVVFYDNKLFCFIETDLAIDRNAVIEFLTTKLLQHEIPKVYFPINSIPKTPNAKIDFDNLKKQIEEWQNG